MSSWAVTLLVITAIGSGMMAGVFFVFSVAVMPALGRLPAHEGIAAMQAINVAIVNPLFLTAFLGTAILAAVLIAAALSGGLNAGRVYAVSGALAYLAGALGLTIAFNVPRNNALAAVDPASAAGAALWKRYLREWTAWNHVRAFASIAATVAFCLALVEA